MENLGVGESTTAVMPSGPVQDVPVEAGPVGESNVHEVPLANIISSDHSLQNNEERESKRPKPWINTWSNNNNDHFARPYHQRDNNTNGYYGQNQRGYNGRGRFSTNYRNEGQRDQTWTRGGQMHHRCPQPMTYQRDNVNNSTQLYGYHGHRYQEWNASARKHHANHYVEGEQNCTTWENKRSRYDGHQHPWTNDKNQNHWTNDRQPPPWINRGDNLSHRGAPNRYYGRGNYNLQSGGRGYRVPMREESYHTPPATSYGAHGRGRGYRVPMREESRNYYGSARAGSTSHATHNMETAAVSDMTPTNNDQVERTWGTLPDHKNDQVETTWGMWPGHKNDQVERTWGMWPGHCDRSPILQQIEMKNEKFELEAKQEVERLPSFCLGKKLLILDVNGLLADVIFPPPKEDKADINICRRAIFKRPHLNDFLMFCFETFNVAIWSSRTKKILDNVVDYLLGDMRSKLLFCWDQSHCTKTGFKTLENKHKELLLKDIKKVWEKSEADVPWEKGYYNEANTLLLDDSPYKALLNPRHSAIFPYTFSYKDESDNSLGIEGDLRVYLTGLATAENVKKYVEEHPFGQRPIDETNSSWAYYLEIIASQSPGQPQISSQLEPPQPATLLEIV